MPGASALQKTTPARTIKAGYQSLLRSARSTGSLPRPVASRPGHFGNWATDVGRSTRLQHVLATDATDLTLVYGNWGNQDAEPNSPIKVIASIEYPAGVYHKVHFPGEDTTRAVTIMPGGMTQGQPVSHFPMKAGTTFWTNTTVVPVNAGGQYPVGGLNIVGGHNTVEACTPASTTDYTTSANPGNASTQFGYGPLYVGGTSTNTVKPVYAVIGDSLSIAVGDSPINNVYESGYLARALNAAGYAYLQLGCNGEKTNDWDGNPSGDPIGSARSRNRQMILNVADIALVEHGTNDMGTGVVTALSVMQGNIIGEWKTVAAHAMPIYQMTITPQTVSTDSWATTTGQTAKYVSFGPEGSGGSCKQNFNKWLRDGAPLNYPALTAAATGATGAGIVRAGQPGHLLLGVLDVAAAVEVYEPSTDTWVYQVSAGTVDGIHPGAAGHTAMATRLRTLLGI